MAQNPPLKAGRITERLFLLLITTVLSLLFISLYFVQQRNFEEVVPRLADGTMLNLNSSNAGEEITTLLTKGYYFDDKKDIALIHSIVAQGLDPQKPVDNIGELNKRKYFVDADEAFLKGGESFRSRVKSSRSLVGFTGADSVLFTQERLKPIQLSSATDVGLGKYSISGKITNKEKQAVAGVLVRLQMILPQDSSYSDQVTEIVGELKKQGAGFNTTYILDSAKNSQLQSLTAYSRTDQNGSYKFQHLPDEKAYEILPMQPGFQFGLTQGVETLDKDKELRNFIQSPHTIRLFSTRDFNILKKERSLIVRTPTEFNNWYWIIVGCFLGGFILVHILLSWRFPEADQIIIPVVMLLSGLSFLTLLSLQDPLRDRFLAKDTLLYFGIGLLGIVIMMFLKLKKFNVDSKLYRMFFLKDNRKASNGWPWAALALILLALTVIFGTGPEGSGVKVNLFGAQPSEVVKYLVIIFLAGFFSTNERFISEYRTYRKRWSFFSFALISILGAILLFLILGDLGPAMVVCFTFIVLFSFSRGDFMFMIASVVVYVFAAWLLNNIWLATAITFAVVGLAMAFKLKQLSESAVMAVVIIAGFLLLDQVPYLDKIFPGPVERLVQRKSIWQDAWNNEVYGGDQVANGIWAMSSGGISGQGIGEGFAKTIPEAHTDMILPAVGEEFGWAGIICIFILFLIYLHRSIIIGRKTGTPFLFYICTGIGVSTFVQFLLIAGGSTGALPLSGVSLPFLSYGGSSLVLNFFAAGFLLSASRIKGTEVQMSFITKQQDRNLVPALAAALIGVVLLTVNVSRYLFNNKKWVVQPALVADRSGARMFSYNPRIAILMNRLQAGSLYDREGRILATSKPELIKNQLSLIRAAGQYYNLDSAVHKRLDRYYPFAEQTFFWIGDANTGIFKGGINGYFAEYEHAAELRGFHTPVENLTALASAYREDRFLARGVKEMTVSKRDYSELAPLLLAGINSKEVEDFKKRNRDVQLSIDAQLQTNIQKSVAQDTALLDNRVSVVVMEDATGDVLASANYPLPQVNNWEQMTMTTREQNKLSQWVTTADLGFTYATQPGSTAKVATTLAAFNKLGSAAADVVYTVNSKERIRTKGIEPDETGRISLERALVKSNNVYFIKIANEQQLQDEMASVYLKSGMFLHGVGGYYYEKNSFDEKQESKWRDLWHKTEFNTKPPYDPNNIRKTRSKGISGMAWGQGALIATPAAIARMVAGVANDGNLVPNRYVLKVSDSPQPVKTSIKLAKDPKHAAIVEQYMIKQSADKAWRLGGLSVAGKSGTPERVWKNERINDGWYVFYASKAKGAGHVVVCIRIESTKGSSDAVALAGKHVIPFLMKKGYIKGFEAPKPSLSKVVPAPAVSASVPIAPVEPQVEESTIEPDTAQ